MKGFVKLSTRAVYGAGLLWCPPTMAQALPNQADTSSQAASSDDASASLTDIVVTARRREESLQDVPVAVTAMGALALEKSGVTNVLNIASQTPGVTMTQFNVGQPQTYIRGVGSQTDSAASESSVTVSMDDVAIGRGGASPVAFLDTNRVEVLRGPQGTLYGRNASAGMISFYANRPTDRFEGRVEASAGSFQTYGGKAIVNAPVATGVAIRAAGQYSTSDGYAKNIATGEDLQGGTSYAGRLQLQAETGALTVLLSGDYAKDDLDGDSRYVLTNYTTNPGFVALVKALQAPRKNVWESQGVPGTYQNRRNYGLVARIEYDADWATLTSISAYRNNRYGVRSDLSGLYTLFPFSDVETIDERSHQFSQELRLNSTSASRIQWVAGLFYYKDNIVRDKRYLVASRAPLPTVLSGDANAFQDADTTSYAAFGQVSLPFASIWELTLGGRITHDKKHVFQQAIQNGPAGRPLGFPFFPGSLYAVPADASFTKPTWRATLAVEPAAGKHFYISYDRGYKSGTFTSQAQNATQATFVVRPERLDSFNLGMKTQWLDNTLRVNADLFYIDYKNLQVFEFGSSLNYVLANANATIKGAEVQLLAAPSRHINVGTNFSYLDGKFSSNPTFAGATLPYDGNRLSRAPKYKMSNYIEYTNVIFDGDATARVSHDFQDDYFYNPSNDVASLQKSYSVLNGFVSWASRDGLKVSVAANNITNAKYTIHHVSFQNTELRIFGPPRSFTVTIAKSF